ncbi:MAG: hypothetical protein U0Q16_01780 [Bryobacteraceae bacterium]
MGLLSLSKIGTLFTSSGGKMGDLEAAMARGDFEAAEDLIADLRKSHGAGPSPKTYKLDLIEARFRFQCRDFRNAYLLLKPCFEQSLASKNEAETMQIFNLLFKCLVDLQRPEEALAVQAQLVWTLRPRPRVQAELQIASAQLAMQSGLAQDAVRLLENALECLESIREEEQINDQMIQATSLMGDAFLSINQPGEAIDAWGWALSLTREKLGDGHPQVAAMLGSIGSLQVLADDLHGARRSLEEALRIYGSLQRDEGIEAGLALNNLAFVLMTQGDLVTAEQAAKQAARIGAQLDPQLHTEAKTTLDKIHTLTTAAEQAKQGDSIFKTKRMQTPVTGMVKKNPPKPAPRPVTPDPLAALNDEPDEAFMPQVPMGPPAQAQRRSSAAVGRSGQGYPATDNFAPRDPYRR